MLAPLGKSVPRLSQVICWLLRISVLIAVAQIALDVWGFTAVVDALDGGDITTATTFDDLDSLLSILLLLQVVVTAVCWMVWQYRIAKSMPSGWLRRGPGMHAFSWFIPFGNLVLPCQNLADLYRLNLPGRSRASVGWWWACWLGSGLLAAVANAMTDRINAPEDFQQVVVVDALGAGVSVAGALLAVRIVGLVTGARTSAPTTG